MEMRPRSIGVHDGAFHADEVTACALLILFNLADKDKIIRTRDASLLKNCEFVCDVGGIYDPGLKRFDHHQVDYQGELSSAGMILLYLKSTKIISTALYDFYNHSLVLGVDAHDNGRFSGEIGHCNFSGVISNFVPPEQEISPEEMNRWFFKALEFTYDHLKRLRHRFEYIQECKKDVEKVMESSHEVLYFDHSIPWIEAFFELGGESHPAKFLIMPTGSHWKLRGIPPSLRERMKVRIPLPEEWAGLSNEDLERVSGIKGAIFCHKGRFISVWKTKEAAEMALRKVLKKERH